jgi:predicted acyl esterase
MQFERQSVRSEVRDGMRIDWDIPIPMDDGAVLRADLFRPDDDRHHPVIFSCGAFGKPFKRATRARGIAWSRPFRKS